jgi:glutamate/aspartate transport system permease protein
MLRSHRPVEVIAAHPIGFSLDLCGRDGRLVEMYLTVGVIYFAICYAASQFVKRLQGRLAYGVR